MRNGKREAQMRTNGKREAQMRANVETRNGKRECTSGPPYDHPIATVAASPIAGNYVFRNATLAARAHNSLFERKGKKYRTTEKFVFVWHVWCDRVSRCQCLRTCVV